MDTSRVFTRGFTARGGLAKAFSILLLSMLIVVSTCGVGFASTTRGGLTTASTDEVTGQFIVAVVGQDDTYILEPTFIEYTEDQSAQDALTASDYKFVFSDTYLESVMDVVPENGSYSYYHTKGSGLLANYDASDISAIIVTSNTAMGYLDSNHLAVLEAIGEYLEGSDGLHGYSDAVDAYNAAVSGLPTADSDTAATLAENLVSAIESYEDYIGGETYEVEFKVTCNGEDITDAALITLEDIYGNVADVDGGKADVVAGEYTYEVLDSDGLNGVRCTSFTVDDTTEDDVIEVDIPTANWFGSIDLQVKSNGKASCEIVSGSVSSRYVTYAVPDIVDAVADLYVYAVASDELQSVSNYTNYYTMRAVYEGTNGTSYTNRVNFESSSSAPQYMVDEGLEGNEVVFEIRHELDDDTYEVEICNATLTRSPTLGSLSAMGDGLEYITDFSPWTTGYSVTTTSSSLDVTAIGSIEDGDYAITVNGEAVDGDGTCTVDIPASAYTEPYEVSVVATLENGNSEQYTVSVTRCDAVSVALAHDSDVEVAVYNEAGSAVSPTSTTDDSSVFGLVEGATYTYVATKGTYYHTTKAFEAGSGTTVTVSTPSTVDLVDELVAAYNTYYVEETTGTTTSTTKSVYDSEATDSHNYTFTVPDTYSAFCLKAVPSDSSDEICYEVAYTSQTDGDSLSKTGSWNSKGYASTNWTEFVHKGCGYSSSTVVEVYASDVDDNGATCYQDYNVTAVRELSLSDIGVTSDSGDLVMYQTPADDDSEKVTDFESDVYDYTIDVSAGTSSIEVGYAFSDPGSDDVSAMGGYYGTLAGVTSEYSYSGVVQTVELDTTLETEVLTIVVTHEDESAVSSTYILRVNQLPAASVSFSKTPSDATVNVINVLTDTRVSPNDDGTYSLITSFEYTYTAACSGYVGTKGSFEAEDGLVIEVSLEQAEENTEIDSTITAEWPLFRADENNNSVVDDPISTSSDETVLYWATQLGDGYDADAVGCPILVDGYLYTYAGDNIYKVDTVSGEVVASGTMVGTSSFAITPMTYAEGMVFIALSNGRVQAFNADTLESLWVYQSDNGGQPNCPITYCDGKIYTGFWNYTNKCDFVCLTITDEDPTQTQESKIALWEYPHYGGFYWAGAYACEDYVVVGSDSAELAESLSVSNEGNDSGALFSFDPTTGEVLDTITEYPGGVEVGNIRSTVVYDDDSDKLYWVTRGGYFCSVSMNEDGTFDDSTLTVLRLENESSDGTVCSTATPVIYNGRAYVDADTGSYEGVSGGHCVDVIDLDTMTIAYTVRMGGRSQSSPLLTTAYEDDEGYVYLYWVDNYTPGKIRYFKDKAGQTEAITSTVESGYLVADVLFSPSGAQAQYCICSPIVDEYGTIYIKNDSAYMMAIGSTIESIEVTTPPDRTVYELGETFDPTGMVVTATYSNGMTRDITDYVTYQTEEFEITGTQTLVIEFPYTMYQNSTTDGDVGSDPDWNYDCPTATLELTVSEQIPPSITTESLPTGMAATSLQSYEYEAQIEATGTTGDCTWTLEGDLPEGLSFDAETATISGTPAAGTGGEYELRFTVTNDEGSSSKTLTLTIYEIPTVSGGALPDGTERASYSAQLETTGGYPEEVTSWTLSGGELPDGLELNESTGTISGIPTESGDFSFYVNAANEAGTSYKTEMTIHIDPYTEGAAITTESISTADVGVEYSQEFSATGEPGEFEWTLEGELPEGLEFDASAGTISGTPAVGSGGAYQFELTADNGIGVSTKAYTLWVYEDPSVETDELVTAALGVEYSFQLEAGGYPADFTWSIESGELPEGLGLDSSTGAISGTPTEKGEFEIVVKIESASTGKSAEATLTLVVGEASAAEISTGSIDAATVGEVYTVQFEATGTPDSFEWTLEGELPEGLEFDASTGTISGTPAEGSGGEYTVTVTAGNGVGSDSETFVLVVGEAPSITTGSLEDATEDEAYSVMLSATGYPEEFTWSLADGSSLPSGLTLDAGTGTISGIPTVPGTFTFTVVATNSYGSASVELELDVEASTSNATITRLYGSDRYATMRAIVSEAYAGETCDYVVVASGEVFADALSAASLAGALDAPILLVGSDDASAAVEAMEELEPGTGLAGVYVVGGIASVSDGVAGEVAAAAGLDAYTRVKGDTRQETSVEVAQTVLALAGDDAPTTAIVASGTSFADALSASPYSYMASAPIYLAESDGTVSAETLSAIEEAGYSQVLVVGGTASVTSGAESELESIVGGGSVERFSGDSRYETSAAFAEWCVEEAGMTYDGCAVAYGGNFPDALAGATICGRSGSVLLLCDGSTVAGINAGDGDESWYGCFADAASSVSQVYLLGGTGSVTGDSLGTAEGVFDALGIETTYTEVKK